MEWTHMLAYITGTVDQELLLRNEYVAAENRILRAQFEPIGPCRVTCVLRCVARVHIVECGGGTVGGDELHTIEIDEGRITCVTAVPDQRGTADARAEKQRRRDQHAAGHT